MMAEDTKGEPAAYSILVPFETYGRAAAYLQLLRAGGLENAGSRLRARLQTRGCGLDIETMSKAELLGELIDTKQPQIFAESAVAGDGSDWTLTELELLGDISVAVPVTVFDDGRHVAPKSHAVPFGAVLLYTPGALLRNDTGHTPADWAEAVGSDGTLSLEGYYGLYRRRLLPVFDFANSISDGPRSTILTIPGLGCGQFAGPFRGHLGSQLEIVLAKFLTEHGASFPNLKAVYFDPYNECHNSDHEIHGISYRIRPLTAPGSGERPQLCPPEAYAEEGDDFSRCSLASVVAWDHVSWPGNDFYIGSRTTDDGVKAAATSSMHAITGIEGSYDPSTWKYQPPEPYQNWETVVTRNALRLWEAGAAWHASP